MLLPRTATETSVAGRSTTRVRISPEVEFQTLSEMWAQTTSEPGRVMIGLGNIFYPTPVAPVTQTPKEQQIHPSSSYRLQWEGFS